MSQLPPLCHTKAWLNVASHYHVKEPGFIFELLTDSWYHLSNCTRDTHSLSVWRSSQGEQGIWNFLELVWVSMEGAVDLLFNRLHQEESSGMRAVFCALLDCVLDYYTTLRKNPLHTHTHTLSGGRWNRKAKRTAERLHVAWARRGWICRTADTEANRAQHTCSWSRFKVWGAWSLTSFKVQQQSNNSSEKETTTTTKKSIKIY